MPRDRAHITRVTEWTMKTWNVGCFLHLINLFPGVYRHPAQNAWTSQQNAPSSFTQTLHRTPRSIVLPLKILNGSPSQGQLLKTSLRHGCTRANKTPPNP